MDGVDNDAIQIGALNWKIIEYEIETDGGPQPSPAYSPSDVGGIN